MPTFTITFGDQAENNIGMQVIGNYAKNGFTYADLQNAITYANNKNLQNELYCLNDLLDTKYKEGVEQAYVLIIRGFLKKPEYLYDELIKLPWDKQALFRGQVKNKIARWNLCFGDNYQEPNYQEGKGTIIAWDNLVFMKHIKNLLPTVLGDAGKDLVAEGNYYYNSNTCGIGYHGDSERKKVFAVRVGDSMPISFAWYTRFNQISEKKIFNINSGDIYIMSDKTVGYDWKKSSKITLRHAAGNKYI